MREAVKQSEAEKLRELYPNFNAKQYEKDLTKHIIYKHDETGPAVYPYCCAVTMYPYLLRGLQDIGGLSAAPKNLDSFCGMFLHLVFASYHPVVEVIKSIID